MRKIIVLSFITLDGVMQAPGGPEEDESGKFKFGGWTAPFNDEFSGKVMQKEMTPADLLLGRKTFQIFANYWPEHSEIWQGINEVNKYFISKKMKKTDPLIAGWNNSFLLRSMSEIKKLKRSKGRDLKIWGSSKLVQSLLKNDLVDEFWLNIHPVILGKGKKLFDDGAIPATFKLVDSTVTPKGIIMANYKKVGKVKTGRVGS
jgi:dihydrofolate reductase